MLFAQFVEPDEITIFTDCVDKASRLEEECGCDLLRRENLTNTLLAHELFHAVEEQHVKEIYTRTERVELWRNRFPINLRFPVFLRLRLWHSQGNFWI